MEVSFLNPLTCKETGGGVGWGAVWVRWGKEWPVAEAWTASIIVSCYAPREFPSHRTLGEWNESLKKHFHQCLGGRKWSRSVISDSFWPYDWSLPVSSVHGILQARILEWVAFSFSRGSSRSRDWTQVSCIAVGVFTIWATRHVYFYKKQLYAS